MLDDSFFKEVESTTKDPDTDYVPDEIKDLTESLVYGLYTKLRNYQYHYNLIKVKYKVLSFSWLFATFIGFGYLFSGKEGALPFGLNYLVVVSLLSVLASVGLLLLCFLDVAVYHRLIEVIFRGCLYLENKHSYLMQTHHMMAKFLNKGRVVTPVFYDGLFYIGFTTILLIIADTCLMTHFVSLGCISSFYAKLAWLVGLFLITTIDIALIFYVDKSSFNHLFLRGKR